MSARDGHRAHSQGLAAVTLVAQVGAVPGGRDVHAVVTPIHHCLPAVQQNEALSHGKLAASVR